jgi:hypothetical protein
MAAGRIRGLTARVRAPRSARRSSRIDLQGEAARMDSVVRSYI